MVYDLTMLKTFYAAYSEKIERVRNVLQRPMTLAEKILYAPTVWPCRMQRPKWPYCNL